MLSIVHKINCMESKIRYSHNLVSGKYVWDRDVNEKKEVIEGGNHE